MELKITIPFALLITNVFGGVLNTVDRRNTADATGSDVIEATLDELENKCLLGDKPGLRKMMRLVAFANSLDGARTSSSGTGMFGVDSQMFQRTQNFYASSMSSSGKKRQFQNNNITTTTTSVTTPSTMPNSNGGISNTTTRPGETTTKISDPNGGFSTTTGSNSLMNPTTTKCSTCAYQYDPNSVFSSGTGSRQNYSFNYQESFTKIEQESSIKWNSVMQTDLAKPKTGAIGLGLFLGDPAVKIPVGIEGMAELWANSLTGGSRNKSDFIEAAKTLPVPKSPPVDLALMVDTSSQSSGNINDIKTAVDEVIRKTEMGSSATKVAVAKFDSVATVTHSFADTQSTSSVETKVNSLASESGSSRLDLAINKIPEMYQQARPKSEAVPKVVTLVVSGPSADPTATIQAANSMKISQPDVEVFILVVNADMTMKARQEFQAIATEPACSHVVQVLSPLDVPLAIESIKERAGKVPAKISTNYTAKNELNFQMSGEIKQMQEKVDASKGRKITLEVTSGQDVTLYGSTKEPNPSEAFYDLKITCPSGQSVTTEIPASELTAAFGTISGRRKRQTGSGGNSMYYAMKGIGTVKMITDEISTATATTTTTVPSVNSAGGTKLNASLLFGMFWMLIGLF